MWEDVNPTSHLAVVLHCSPYVLHYPPLLYPSPPLTEDEEKGEGEGGSTEKAGRYPGLGTLQATGGRFCELTDGSQTREKPG